MPLSVNQNVSAKPNIESQKSKHTTFYQSATFPPVSKCSVYWDLWRKRVICKKQGSSWMIRVAQLHLVIYSVTKKSKDLLHTSTKLHHITTVILSACILVITVISDSQCRLNKGRFHGSIHLLLKKCHIPLKSTMGF